MFSISQIRAQARQTINSTPGIYLLPLIPVGISLLMTLIQYFRSNSMVYYDPTASLAPFFGSLAFPMLYGLLIGFIFISLAWTLLQVVRGVKTTTDIKDALAVFNSPHLGKIFCTYLLKQFFLFLWGLVSYIGLALILAGSILAFFYGLYSSYGEAMPEEYLAIISIMMLGGLILTLGGLALLIPQYMAYSQVEFILFDQLQKNEYAGASAIIRTSRQMMKGYKGKRFVLDLSFIGWFILSGITFGLVGIYVWPYYYAAQAHFYEAIQADFQARQAAYFGQFQTSPASFQSSDQATTETSSSPVSQNFQAFGQQATETNSPSQTIEESVDSPASPSSDQPVENHSDTPEQAVENKMDSAIDSPIDHQE